MCECFSFGPLFEHVHDWVSYSSFLAFKFCFYAKQLLFFIEDNECFFFFGQCFKKSNLLWLVLDWFIDFLLNKIDGPIFAPL